MSASDSVRRSETGEAMAEGSSKVAVGVFLIVLGLVALAGRQHFIPVVGFGRLWPLILILLGFGRFAAKTDDGKHRGGLWFMFIGGLFLLHTLDIVRIDQSWPLFIVAGGVSILYGRREHRGAAGDQR